MNKTISPLHWTHCKTWPFLNFHSRNGNDSWIYGQHCNGRNHKIAPSKRWHFLSSFMVADITSGNNRIIHFKSLILLGHLGPRPNKGSLSRQGGLQGLCILPSSLVSRAAEIQVKCQAFGGAKYRGPLTSSKITAAKLNHFYTDP